MFQRLQAFAQERVKDNPASTPTHDELRSNFGTFLEGVFKQVVLVVDAIDESSMRECMIGDLKTFKKQCPFIKILVSSREELDITKAFKSFPHVKINQSDVAVSTLNPTSSLSQPGPGLLLASKTQLLAHTQDKINRAQMIDFLVETF